MWLPLVFSSALAVSPVVDFLPLGVGAYAHRKPVRGVAYTLTQVAGGVVLGVATDRGLGALAEEDSRAITEWQLVGSGGAVLAFGSWFGSMVDCSRVRQLEARESALAGMRDWERARLAGGTRD